MKRWNQKGQITVFVSLLFLVFFLAMLCFYDGIRSYLGQGLVKEGMEAARKDVTANYQKNLFGQYHLFLLDPKEADYIVADGKKSLDHYLGNFAYRCEEIKVMGEQKAMDQKASAIKSQILACMKIKNVKNMSKELEKWAGYCRDTEQKKEKSQQLVEEKTAMEEVENAGTVDETSDTDQLIEAEEKARWKDIKEILNSIIHSGILIYVCDKRQISTLRVDQSERPSASEGLRGGWSCIDPESFSMESMKNLGHLLEQGSDPGQKLTGEDVINLREMSDEYLLLNYWNTYFRDWSDQEWKEETALLYEKEYMLAGRDSDHDNLKAIANRIFLMRFAANFAYACRNPELSAQAELMGLSLGGILGLPQAAEAVKYILLGALSYGESLLDLHTLFAGHKVPLVKNEITWMTNFENIVSLLREKRIVKEGSVNLAYREYLDIFISKDIVKNILCMKMADVIQQNILLKEEDFLIKDCIYAFDWQASFHCPFWNSWLTPTGSDLLYKVRVSYE